MPSERFQELVGELWTVDRNCGDLQRIAAPFEAAADWECETGRVIAEVVGTNNSVDMHMSVERLIDFAKNCGGCALKNEGVKCEFVGVDKLSPEEILTLIEVKK